MAGRVNSLVPLVVGETLIGLNKPTYTSSKILAANVAESITVPVDAKYMFVSGTVQFWLDADKTAVVGIDNDTGDSAILITLPMVISIFDSTVISVISPYACTVSISFYK